MPTPPPPRPRLPISPETLDMLRHLAARLVAERWSTAHWLRLWADAADRPADAVARALGLDPAAEGLVLLALCGIPRSGHWAADIAGLAETAGCRAGALDALYREAFAAGAAREE